MFVWTRAKPREPVEKIARRGACVVSWVCVCVVHFNQESTSTSSLHCVCQTGVCWHVTSIIPSILRNHTHTQTQTGAHCKRAKHNVQQLPVFDANMDKRHMRFDWPMASRTRVGELIHSHGVCVCVFWHWLKPRWKKIYYKATLLWGSILWPLSLNCQTCLFYQTFGSPWHVNIMCAYVCVPLSYF